MTVATFQGRREITMSRVIPTRRPASLPEDSPRPLTEVAILPDDPALPGLAAIRALGVSEALPGLDLKDGPLTISLRGYTPGRRATLEVRAGARRLAIKAWARDPAPMVELHQALGAELAGDLAVRVPPLVAWERGRRLTAFGWLEGPSVDDLIDGGHGPRAGSVAARWLRRSASLRVRLGDPMGATRLLRKAHKWLLTIGLSGAALATPAEALEEALERAKPKGQLHRLVNGSIHSHDMLDLRAATGLVDWRYFGLGPLELDAGLFLAAVHDLGLTGGSAALEVAQATEAFMNGTADLLDPRSLAWHQATGLLRIAYGRLEEGEGAMVRVGALVREAERLARDAGREGGVRAPHRAPAPATHPSAVPDDRELPGLVALRTVGLAAAVPELELGDQPVELTLRTHRPGKRATVEARAGDRHFAIKVYAKQPSVEAATCRALADAGLCGDTGHRVPRLLAWDRGLQLLVIGWLEGPTAYELLKADQGQRAGDLAARWLERASTLSFDFGPSRDAAWMLDRTRKWVAGLYASDRGLGVIAAALAEHLVRSRPKEGVPFLSHGTFHDHNILDLGDAPGVIDWERCGRGPLEFDAGTFLACFNQRGAKGSWAEEAGRAREAFRSRLAGRLDEQALAWHESAALFCRAYRVSKWQERGGPELAAELLDRAREALTGDRA